MRRCRQLGLEPYGSPTTSNQAVLPCPSLKIGPGDSARSHTANEYIRLDEIEKGVETFIRFWDKGYDIDAFTESFTIGKDRELDVMLAKADVTGSLAHLEMLHAIGLVSDEEHGQLRVALVSIYEQVERGEFVIEEGIEDVHSQVELMLVRECGDAGKKIHTGRSRNDQV